MKQHFNCFVHLKKKFEHLLDVFSSPNATGLQTQFIEKLIKSEDIQCISTADFEVDDIEVHEHLLKMIVKLFVTILGFSYAGAWLEHYKQLQKKSTQHQRVYAENYTQIIMFRIYCAVLFTLCIA